ncbi:MAG: hypothetical protein AUJ72_05400 [Candidatus Omnitrophica bacterium CG1_02_46_14]|nr:MAG: hypothetical protein AUJ72_05400 [Candidatus Omnitrophica bacterium CG1_02_46_14]
MFPAISDSSERDDLLPRQKSCVMKFEKQAEGSQLDVWIDASEFFCYTDSIWKGKFYERKNTDEP